MPSASIVPLGIQIFADVKKFNSSIASANKSMGTLQSSIIRGLIGFDSFTASAKILRGVLGFGVSLTKVLTTTAQSAIDFDRNIRTAAIIAGEAFTSVSELSSAMLNLAATIPITAVELSEVAVVIAKFGVATKGGTKAISEFALASAQMAAITGQTVETAAESFAVMSNIFGVTEDAANKFGSAMVALANTTVATSQQIFKIARKFGIVAHELGISAGAALGLAAAARDIGATAEIGGTAFVKIFTAMTTKVDEFAKLTKKPVKDFKNQIFGIGESLDKVDFSKTEAAIEDVLRAFGKMAKGDPEKAVEFLHDLGLQGVRVRPVFAGLANDVDRVVETMKRGVREFERGAELQRKFGEISEATALKLKTFEGAIEGLKIAIGENLLPVFNVLLDVTTQFLALILKIPSPILTLGGVLIALLGGIILLTAGTLALSIGFLALMGFLIILAKQLETVGGLNAKMAKGFIALAKQATSNAAAHGTLSAAMTFAARSAKMLRVQIKKNSAALASNAVVAKGAAKATAASAATASASSMTIGASTASLLGAAAAGIKGIVGSVLGFIASLGGPLIVLIALIGSIIIGFIVAVKSNLAGLGDTFSDLLSSFSALGRAIFSPLAEIMSRITGESKESATVFGTIAKIFKAVLWPVSLGLSVIFKGMAEFINEIAAGMETFAADFGDIFTMFLEMFGIKKDFLGDTKGFQALMRGLQKVVSILTNRAAKVGRIMAEPLKLFIIGFGKMLKGAFIIQKIILRDIRRTLDLISPIVNRIMLGLKSLGFVQEIEEKSRRKRREDIVLPEFMRPKPMAEGGIVTRPTRALIGEAGPEAVIPLKNNNLKIRSTAKKDVVIPVNLIVDGEVVAKAMARRRIDKNIVDLEDIEGFSGRGVGF